MRHWPPTVICEIYYSPRWKRERYCDPLLWKHPVTHGAFLHILFCVLHPKSQGHKHKGLGSLPHRIYFVAKCIQLYLTKLIWTGIMKCNSDDYSMFQGKIFVTRIPKLITFVQVLHIQNLTFHSDKWKIFSSLFYKLWCHCILVKQKQTSKPNLV